MNNTQITEGVKMADTCMVRLLSLSLIIGAKEFKIIKLIMHGARTYDSTTFCIAAACLPFVKFQ